MLLVLAHFLRRILELAAFNARLLDSLEILLFLIVHCESNLNFNKLLHFIIVLLM